MCPTEPPIVIIDYDETHLWHLTAALQQEGYRCLPFTDAREAARYIFGHKVALVITEVLMPGLDGIEILLIHKDLRPELRVIGFCGGREHQLYLSIMAHLGAEAIFPKPIDPVGPLLQAVRRVATWPGAPCPVPAAAGG